MTEYIIFHSSADGFKRLIYGPVSKSELEKCIDPKNGEFKGYNFVPLKELGHSVWNASIFECKQIIPKPVEIVKSYQIP